MPVETVVPRIIEIVEALSEIGRVFDGVPGSINKADLPALIVVPQDATYTRITATQIKERRNYALLLFLSPTTMDRYGEAYRDARRFMRLIPEAFTAANNLRDLPSVTYATVVADSGPQPYTYAQTQYIIVEFTLQVDETYAP